MRTQIEITLSVYITVHFLLICVYEPNQRYSGGNMLSASQALMPTHRPLFSGQTNLPVPWDSIGSHPWWRHQMETFSASLAICGGIHRSPVNSLHKGQWRGASMLSLIRAPINGWVNNGEAGDLRHHRDHYEVTVMHPWSVQRDSTINLYNSICAVDELCASLILHSVILVSLQENIFPQLLIDAV